MWGEEEIEPEIGDFCLEKIAVDRSFLQVRRYRHNREELPLVRDTEHSSEAACIPSALSVSGLSLQCATGFRDVF